MTFTQVGERVVHEGHIVTFAVGTFEAADGTRFDRDIVRHPGAVSVIAVDDRRRVVLVRQFRAPLGESILEVPAGKLDVDGEDPMVCAQRELAEEVGLVAERWEPLGAFHHSPGFCDEFMRIYLAQGLAEVPQARHGIEEEVMTIEWWPLGDTPAMITAGEIHDAKSIIGLLLADTRVPR